jgi:hypothetical protein
MTTKKRRKNRLPPFIPLIKSIMAMPAWRAMSTGARLLNIELRGHLRNDFSNNGSVHLSCRKGAEARCDNHVNRSLVRRERALRMAAQDLRGLPWCRWSRHCSALSLHRRAAWDASTYARLRKMGWRNVRLHPPAAPSQKTESRTISSHTPYHFVTHTEGVRGRVRMCDRITQRADPGAFHFVTRI